MEKTTDPPQWSVVDFIVFTEDEAGSLQSGPRATTDMRRGASSGAAAAAFGLGVVAAVAVVSHGYLGGGRRATLVQRGSGDAWSQGYLFAPPGADNLDYQNEHYGRVVKASRQDSLSSSMGGRTKFNQLHLQSLCGFGSVSLSNFTASLAPGMQSHPQRCRAFHVAGLPL